MVLARAGRTATQLAQTLNTLTYWHYRVLRVTWSAA